MGCDGLLINDKSVTSFQNTWCKLNVKAVFHYGRFASAGEASTVFEARQALVSRFLKAGTKPRAKRL